MSNQSPFHEEWRRCLREQYKAVIRIEDKITERTLTKVLYRVGFTEDELRQLYLEATLRAEDLPEGMLPDASRLPFQVHPAECSCDACQMDQVLDAGHDMEGQPIEPEPVAAPDPEPAGNIFPVAKIAAQAEPEQVIDADSDDTEADDTDAPIKISPKQLSMF